MILQQDEERLNESGWGTLPNGISRGQVGEPALCKWRQNAVLSKWREASEVL